MANYLLSRFSDITRVDIHREIAEWIQAMDAGFGTDLEWGPEASLPSLRSVERYVRDWRQLEGTLPEGHLKRRLLTHKAGPRRQAKKNEPAPPPTPASPQQRIESIKNARLAIVKSVEKQVAAIGISKAVTMTVTAWKKGAAAGVPNWVYGVIPNVHVSQINAWRKTYREHGEDGLKPRWRSGAAHPRPTRGPWNEFFDQVLSAYPGATATELHERAVREAVARGYNAPSIRTCQRAVKKINTHRAANL